jgi:hypothetical protein
MFLFFFFREDVPQLEQEKLEFLIPPRDALSQSVKNLVFSEMMGG